MNGLPEEELPGLASRIGATSVYCHDSDACSEELGVMKRLTKTLNASVPPVPLKGFWGGSTLYHVDDMPFSVPNGLGTTFSSYRKMVENNCSIRPPLDIPALKPLPPLRNEAGIDAMPTASDLGVEGEAVVDERGVLNFEGGETAGLARVKAYIWDNDCLKDYVDTRNGMEGADYSTKFSPWLAAGCISARYIAAEAARYERERIKNKSTYWVVFELLWRDFCRIYCMKYKNKIFHLNGPKGDTGEKKRWSQNRALFEAWATGNTGYPFIDANMRELTRTGFMSNRGRQNVASFLVRDMGMDWRMGAEWFEYQLIDHDPCSNYGNWTYAGGVGCDPREDRYFSIGKQASVYDPEGTFMRRWCPELKDVPFQGLIKGIVNDVPGYPKPVCELLHKYRGGGGKGRNNGKPDPRKGKSSRGRGGGQYKGANYKFTQGRAGFSRVQH